MCVCALFWFVLNHRSGTEKQAVAYDYAKRVSKGNQECDAIIDETLKKLSGAKSHDHFEFERCALANVSLCSVSQNNDEFTVLLYNSIAQSRHEEYVRVPVSSDGWTVQCVESGDSVPIQVVPNVADSSSQKGSSPYSLVFPANVPALGYRTYSFKKRASSNLVRPIEMPRISEDTIVENSKLKLTFGGLTGKLKSIENLADGSKININQEWM